MKKIIAIGLSLMLVFCFAGCGNNAAPENNEVTPSVADSSEADTTESGTVAVGSTITVPFAELTIAEAGIKQGDTQTSSPDEAVDNEVVYISGTFKNTSEEMLPLINLRGTVDVDGNQYPIDGIDIFDADGNEASTFEPLVEYTYTINAEIPGKSVENSTSCTMTFGFDENFEYHNVFDDVPLAYNYTIEISK